MGLTSKQKAFINHYISCGMNATKAAELAGYSKKTAYSQGARLLKNVEISAILKERLDKYAMEANEVLYHLTRIARGDIDSVLDDKGLPDIQKSRDKQTTDLIKKIRSKKTFHEGTTTIEIEVELYDRQTALNTLAKFHNLTNTSIVKTWKDDAIESIRAGKIDYEDLRQVAIELGESESLASELFRLAGVPITG